MLGDFENKRSKAFYGKIKTIKKGFRSRTCLLKDREGRLSVGEDKVIGRWQEYFWELFNPNLILKGTGWELGMDQKGIDLEPLDPKEVEEVI